MISIVMPLIVLVLTITIMWHGYETIRGKGGQNAFLDVFWKSARTMLVVGLALTGGAYISNVVGTVEDVQNTLASLFSGAGSSTNPFEMLDASVGKALDTYGSIWDTAQSHINISITPGIDSDFSGVMMMFQASLMIFFLGLYALVAAMELMGITLALKLHFALGPLFVAFFAFAATAKFFDAWLGSVLKYVMTAVVISVMVGMGNGIFAGYADSIQANLSTLELISVGLSSMVACGLLIYLTTKVSEIAASMVGGIAISAMSPGVAGPLSAIGSMAGGALGGIARGAAHAAGNTAPGAAIAEKVLGAGERYANTGVGALMQAVTGRKGLMESFHSGANRHLQQKASGGGASGTGSVTAGDRPAAAPIQAMMQQPPSIDLSGNIQAALAGRN